ncbi:MAG TPA: methyl-accepting chemotaxis protein [Steroidobacteraceae bacterium]|jgi:methyl-accepting chemotaxis protein
MAKKPQNTVVAESALAREIEELRARSSAQALDFERQLAAADASRNELDQELDSLAARCARITTALDNVSASVLMIDADGSVIYLNRAMQSLLDSVGAALRRELPDFDPAALAGGRIDSLLAKASPPLPHELSAAHAALLKLAGLTLGITATPVFESTSARIGTVIEWLDRTQEVRVEEEVASIVAAAQSGDLRARINAGDKQRFYGKLASGINGLLDSTMQLIEEIKGAATAVCQGAEEISAGTANLSARTEKTAASLEETASSMEQMTATVRQTADNAGHANQLAMAARQQAEKGGTVVGSAVQAMAAINVASKRIADIIGVIDEIAFQTNLLALNAAVEAARAGEQGRGFAVVATEVRNLAGRSATAAKEIKALIQDSVAKVEEGSKLVDESGQTLSEIVSSVKKVTDIVAEIASASREQSAGIEQVNKAVMQMDSTTQQNAALVEQTTAASRGILDHSQALSSLVARYRVSASQPAAQTRTAAAPAERRTTERPWTQAPAKTQSSARTQSSLRSTPAARQAPTPHIARPAAASASRAVAAPTVATDSEWQEF